MSSISFERVVEYEVDFDGVVEHFPEAWEVFDGDEHEFLHYLMNDMGYWPTDIGATETYSHLTFI